MAHITLGIGNMEPNKLVWGETKKHAVQVNADTGDVNTVVSNILSLK